MTLKEKVAKVLPELVNEDYVGGVCGCPYEYSYLDFSEDRCIAGDGNGSHDDCLKCWNQEYVPAKKVDHPAHYRIGKYECIDEMIALFGVEAVKSFCRLNIYKYRYRATQKGGEKDIQKASDYMDILKKLEDMEE